MAIKDHRPELAGKEPEEGYWVALGVFIHQFSVVERMLQILVRLIAGVPPPMGKAIFSGSRGDACKDAINRMCDATGQADRKERLEPTFAQLGHITGARNAFVHWGTTVQDDASLAATNDFIAHIPAKLRSFPVSAEILRDMTYDLMTINVLLAKEAAELIKNPAPATKQNVEAALASGIAFRKSYGVEGPWLYKPPQQSPPAKRSRANRQERKPQDDASRK